MSKYLIMKIAAPNGGAAVFPSPRHDTLLVSLVRKQFEILLLHHIVMNLLRHFRVGSFAIARYVPLSNEF